VCWRCIAHKKHVNASLAASMLREPKDGLVLSVMRFRAWSRLEQASLGIPSALRSFPESDTFRIMKGSQLCTTRRRQGHSIHKHLAHILLRDRLWIKGYSRARKTSERCDTAWAIYGHSTKQGCSRKNAQHRHDFYT